MREGTAIGLRCRDQQRTPAHPIELARLHDVLARYGEGGQPQRVSFEGAGRGWKEPAEGRRAGRAPGPVAVKGLPDPVEVYAPFWPRSTYLINPGAQARAFPGASLD